MWPSWPLPRTASSTPCSRPLWSQPWTVCGTPAYVLPSSWSYPPVDKRKGKVEKNYLKYSIFTCMFWFLESCFLGNFNASLPWSCGECLCDPALQCWADVITRQWWEWVQQQIRCSLLGEVNSHNSRNILSPRFNIYNIAFLPYSQSGHPAGCCTCVFCL